MSAHSGIASPRRARPNVRLIVATAAILVLVVAMALSTKVVRIDSAAGPASGVFSETTFGQSAFPNVQAAVEKRAVDAATLASAIAKNQSAAVKQYSVSTGGVAEFPVKFTGLVGKGEFGTYPVSVSGVPKSVLINVQTGPAILGTDLRDVTGTIKFEQFTNQIEYQNAGSALNKEMKKQVLSKVDTSALTGKTVSVVGAFALSDPANWLITPVRLDVR